VLAATITSADTVLSALNTVQWTLLESMRQFAGRGDEIGDRATRLLDELTTAATADEFTRQLAPVLTGLFQRAVAIVNAAAEQAAAQVDKPAPAPERPNAPVAPTPKRQPVSQSATRVSASSIERDLPRVANEIRDYARRNPGAQIEVSWHVVGEDGY